MWNLFKVSQSHGMHMQVVRPIRQHTVPPGKYYSSATVRLTKICPYHKIHFESNQVFSPRLRFQEKYAYRFITGKRTCWDEPRQLSQKVHRNEYKAQSIELTKGPPELVQHFRL
jgi:hypothetical protein